MGDSVEMVLARLMTKVRSYSSGQARVLAIPLREVEKELRKLKKQ